jgi:hypothetical protein
MPRGRSSPNLPPVPFTRDSLDCLRELGLRFKALGRPLPDHLIVELAIRKLYHEYCLYANDMQISDTPSIKLMKQSKAVLDARYREFVDAERPSPKARRQALSVPASGDPLSDAPR